MGRVYTSAVRDSSSRTISTVRIVDPQFDDLRYNPFRDIGMGRVMERSGDDTLSDRRQEGNPIASDFAIDHLGDDARREVKARHFEHCTTPEGFSFATQ